MWNLYCQGLRSEPPVVWKHCREKSGTARDSASWKLNHKEKLSLILIGRTWRKLCLKPVKFLQPGWVEFSSLAEGMFRFMPVTIKDTWPEHAGLFPFCTCLCIIISSTFLAYRGKYINPCTQPDIDPRTQYSLFILPGVIPDYKARRKPWALLRMAPNKKGKEFIADLRIFITLLLFFLTTFLLVLVLIEDFTLFH